MRTVRGHELPLQLRTRTVHGPDACGCALSADMKIVDLHTPGVYITVELSVAAYFVVLHCPSEIDLRDLVACCSFSCTAVLLNNIIFVMVTSHTSRVVLFSLVSVCLSVGLFVCLSTR